MAVLREALHLNRNKMFPMITTLSRRFHPLFKKNCFNRYCFVLYQSLYFHSRPMVYVFCIPIYIYILQNGFFFVPGCECIIFTSTFGKELGSFSSPDYPKPYPTNIDCILYTFIAARDEIVQISFKDFDVQKKHLE